MKKLVIVALFSALFCLAPFTSAFADQASPVEISTPEGLAAIADDPNGNYVLAADIDMKGVDWKPISFSGTLDGGGHTIFNLTVTQLGDEHAMAVATPQNIPTKYDTVFAGLFSVVRGATIKDLNLLNVNVHISTDQNCFAAGLAGFAEDTTITGCSVKGRLYLDKRFKIAGVSGVVGFGRVTVTDCSADVEVVYIGGDSEKPKCEEFIGAILALGYADIEDCTIKLRAYASVLGYCHNGGIVGMYYVYKPVNKQILCAIKGCTSDTAIYFYENNRDRRAYCKPDVGERMSAYASKGNKTIYFHSGETKDYSKYVLPEKDSDPAYTAAVTAPSCTEFGYTTYTCPKCGYSYTDDYVAPAHTPGDWAVEKEPTFTETGFERLYCVLCGELLGEREIPMHVAGDWVVVREPTYDASGLEQLHDKLTDEVLDEREIPKLVCVSSCKLEPAELKLNYKGSASLSAEILPADASDTDLKWTSSDENVAAVDAQGNVYAAGRGEAVITCTSADGNATCTCGVTVTYTFWQWIVVYILFGWIWY
jgi:hypothetical protein